MSYLLVLSAITRVPPNNHILYKASDPAHLAFGFTFLIVGKIAPLLRNPAKKRKTKKVKWKNHIQDSYRDGPSDDGYGMHGMLPGGLMGVTGNEEGLA